MQDCRAKDCQHRGAQSSTTFQQRTPAHFLISDYNNMRHIRLRPGTRPLQPKSGPVLLVIIMAMGAAALHTEAGLFNGQTRQRISSSGATNNGSANTQQSFVANPAATPNPDCLPDSVCPEWTTRHDSPSHLYDHGYDVITSPDGSRVYVTGGSTSTAGGPDYLTIAYAADTGQELWQARYDSPSHGADYPAGFSALGSAIQISADGQRIFVTGTSPAPAAQGSISPSHMTLRTELKHGAVATRLRWPARRTLWL